jgi:ABC-type lipoprotein export system ATPase subunit
MLMDLNVDFPLGELTLISGPLGSGKTLLLLGETWEVLDYIISSKR